MTATAEAQGSPYKSTRKPRRREWLTQILLIGSVLLAVGAGIALTLENGLWTLPNWGERVEASAPSPVTEDPLVERKLALAEAEAALQMREDALKEREVRVSQKEQQASDLLEEIMAQKEEEDAITRVAQIYSLMPPHKASAIIQSMQTQLAVQVMRLLENEDSAALLALMDPESSAAILTQLTQPEVLAPAGELSWAQTVN